MLLSARLRRLSASLRWLSASFRRLSASLRKAWIHGLRRATHGLIVRIHGLRLHKGDFRVGPLIKLGSYKQHAHVRTAISCMGQEALICCNWNPPRVIPGSAPDCCRWLLIKIEWRKKREKRFSSYSWCDQSPRRAETVSDTASICSKGRHVRRCSGPVLELVHDKIV